MRSLKWCVLTLLCSGCVTVPNSTICTVAGRLAAGMVCAETNTPKTFDLDLDQTIEFLEPVEQAPKRAGAVCMSAQDWIEMKSALEQACRQLGNKCKFEGAPKK